MASKALAVAHIVPAQSRTTRTPPKTVATQRLSGNDEQQTCMAFLGRKLHPLLVEGPFALVLDIKDLQGCVLWW